MQLPQNSNNKENKAYFQPSRLSQDMLAKRLAFSQEMQATVLEVKAIPGLGTTIDIVLLVNILRISISAENFTVKISALCTIIDKISFQNYMFPSFCFVR
jgi:hypothetical protein